MSNREKKQRDENITFIFKITNMPYMHGFSLTLIDLHVYWCMHVCNRTRHQTKTENLSLLNVPRGSSTFHQESLNIFFTFAI